MVRIWTLVTLCFAFACLSDFALGQTRIAPAPLRPNFRPTTSPFLLLGNGRFSSALNYYRRVRPERELRGQSLGQFQEIQKPKSRYYRS